MCYFLTKSTHFNKKQRKKSKNKIQVHIIDYKLSNLIDFLSLLQIENNKKKIFNQKMMAMWREEN